MAYSVGGADTFCRNVQWATHFVANGLVRAQSLSDCRLGWQLVRRVASSCWVSDFYCEEILETYFLITKLY